MTITLLKETRTEAVRSIERYFTENMDEPIGNLAADALLAYFLEEIAPLVYNQAVTDVQERMQMRVAEIDIEVHEDEFQYWSQRDRSRRKN